MTTETKAIANSFGFWLACSPLVFILIFQTIIFMKKAWKQGVKIGLEKKRMKRGIRSSVISSIGPALSILITLVGLIAVVGSALAWMRLSVIGSIMFEGIAAENALSAMGTAVGDSAYTPDALAAIVFVMALSSGGWLLTSATFTPKLDKIRMKAVGGKEELLPIFTIGAVLGAFAFQASKYIVKVNKSTVAVIAGFISMVILNWLAQKLEKKFIKEWALGISMVVAMLTTTLI